MIHWTSKFQNFGSLFMTLQRGHRRGRLVYHYFLTSVFMIAGGLITSGILETYFRYRESREHIGLLQQEAANVAALQIATFIHDVETGMKAATKYPDLARQG